MTAQIDLCQTWLETQIVGFLSHANAQVRIEGTEIDTNEPVHENNLGSDQVRHKPVCTVIEDG